jgi:hypothetical protein
LCNRLEFEAERAEILASRASCRNRLALDSLRHVAKISPSDPEWLVRALALGGGVALEDVEIRAKLHELIDQRSPKFFSIVERIKRQKKFTAKDLVDSTDRVKMFLVDYWILDEGGPIEGSLTYYSYPALARLIDWHFGQPPTEWRSLRSVVVRLGLKKSRFTLFRDIQIHRTKRDLAGIVSPIPLRKLVPKES